MRSLIYFFTWGILLCLLNISAKLFSILAIGFRVVKFHIYSETCVKQPLKNRQNKVLNDKW